VIDLNSCDFKLWYEEYMTLMCNGLDICAMKLRWPLWLYDSKWNISSIFKSWVRVDLSKSLSRVWAWLLRGQVECKKIHSGDRPSKRKFECETRRVMSLKTNVVWCWDIVKCLERNKLWSYEVSMLSKDSYIARAWHFWQEAEKRKKMRRSLTMCCKNESYGPKWWVARLR
jgi:hypothetical protein